MVLVKSDGSEDFESSRVKEKGLELIDVYGENY